MRENERAWVFKDAPFCVSSIFIRGHIYNRKGALMGRTYFYGLPYVLAVWFWITALTLVAALFTETEFD